jgi:hypothetical protein
LIGFAPVPRKISRLMIWLGEPDGSRPVHWFTQSEF